MRFCPPWQHVSGQNYSIREIMGHTRLCFCPSWQSSLYISGQKVDKYSFMRETMERGQAYYDAHDSPPPINSTLMERQYRGAVQCEKHQYRLALSRR